MERASISIGLLHFPVYNKNKEVVISSITTSSLHDISRTARTFGVDNFYIITPLKLQQDLIDRLLKHWQVGYGAQYNPTRRDAFQKVLVVSTLVDCLDDLKRKYRQDPITIVTSALSQGNCISYADLRDRIHRLHEPYLIVFGTGWGIEQSLIKNMDMVIEPVYGRENYNHLSVRAAVAIILDRLINESR